MSTQTHAMLGCGTYGCVIRPPIPCGYEDLEGEDFVGKIMDTLEKDKDKYADDEMDAAEALYCIDPEQKYFLYPLVACHVLVKDVLQIPGADTCVFLKNKKEDEYVPQLWMKYGGRTLQYYLKQLKSDGVFLSRKQVIKILKPLFTGVERLIRCRLAHQDIKLNNILVRNDRARLIDFGLLATEDTFYTHENILWEDHKYAVNPPEYRLLRRKDLDTVTESELLLDERVIMMDYTNSYNKVDKLWYKYYGLGNVMYMHSMRKLQTTLQNEEGIDGRIRVLQDMECIQKCDLYALGFLLFQLSPALLPPHEDNKAAVRTYKLLVHGLLNPCPEDRIDVWKAFEYIDEIEATRKDLRVFHIEESIADHVANIVNAALDGSGNTPKEVEGNP